MKADARMPGRRQTHRGAVGFAGRLVWVGLVAAGGAAPASQPSSPPPSPASATVPATAEAYAAAVAVLRAAEAAAVHARQQAAIEYRAAPAYATVARDVAAAFDAYGDRRNGLMLAVEQHDPRYATWKRGAADAEAELARAAQAAAGGPAVTAEQFDQLLGQRAEFARQLQASEDDAVNRDAEAKRLREQWVAACGRLSEVRAKQATAVEAAAAVRAAAAAVADAKAAVERSRPATGAAEAAEPSAVEFARRYPRHGLDWSDVVGPRR